MDLGQFSEYLTVEVEESFGVKIVWIKTVCFLPNFLQLILTALQTKHIQH